MSSRTIIIFSIFVAVVIIASTFSLLYREQTDMLIDRYIAKITVCGNIVDEEACFTRSSCKGIYGPSCPDCDDSVFLNCVKLSPEALAILEKQKNLCQSTGGSWSEERRGNSCFCGGAGRLIFHQQYGCIPLD